MLREPIPKSRHDRGSVQGRKWRKRIAQKKTFILSEKKTLKAQDTEFRRKRDKERIERKMLWLQGKKLGPSI